MKENEKWMYKTDKNQDSTAKMVINKKKLSLDWILHWQNIIKVERCSEEQLGSLERESE